jgi:hypothetical protein
VVLDLNVVLTSQSKEDSCSEADEACTDCSGLLPGIVIGFSCLAFRVLPGFGTNMNSKSEHRHLFLAYFVKLYRLQLLFSVR